jgi:hypothetical protein
VTAIKLHRLDGRHQGAVGTMFQVSDQGGGNLDDDGFGPLRFDPRAKLPSGRALPVDIQEDGRRLTAGGQTKGCSAVCSLDHLYLASSQVSGRGGAICDVVVDIKNQGTEPGGRRGLRAHALGRLVGAPSVHQAAAFDRCRHTGRASLVALPLLRYMAKVIRITGSQRRMLARVRSL